MQNYWENELYETGSESSSSASDESSTSPTHVAPPPPSLSQSSSGLKLRLPALAKPPSSGLPKIILKPPKPPSKGTANSNGTSSNILGNSNDIDYSGPSSSAITLPPTPDIITDQTEFPSDPPPPLPSLAPKAKKNKGPKAKFGFGRRDKGKKKDNGPKVPRPPKLRPLKGVLERLIASFMKKDSYGFFLHPVDPSSVPGYSDVITTPMDFGTMENKVSRGRYKNLDEFRDDFQLTLENAKTFNPPDSIYYTEANRILAWGLDAISKASPTILLHQMDWSFGNEDNHEVDVDGEGGSTRAPSTVPDDMPADTIESDALLAASLARNGPGPKLRRGIRESGQKKAAAAEPDHGIENTISPDGRLPGSLDALGVFPPGSEWAQTVLHLKKRAYKYKTKKERMKVEREGPPLLPDGSRDIWRYEHPVSLLADLIAERDPTFHPTRPPQVLPLYPPLVPVTRRERSSSPTPAATPAQPQSSRASATPGPQTQSELHIHDDSFKTPSFFPSSNTNAPLPHLSSSSQSTLSRIKLENKHHRSHWVVARPATAKRGRLDGPEPSEEIPPWKVPRVAAARDWGSFSTVGSANVGSPHLPLFQMPPALSEEEQDRLLYAQALRNSLDPATLSSCDYQIESPSYWSLARACEAEEYLRDLVYGGVDGFAYTQSLGEFLSPSRFPPDAGDDDMDVDSPSEAGTLLRETLAVWVETHIVSPLTEGKQELLRSALLTLSNPDHPSSLSDKGPTVADQVKRSLTKMPEVLRTFLSMKSSDNDKIDMGELIKSTEELWESEILFSTFKAKYRLRPMAENGDVKMLDAATLGQPETLNELVAALLDCGRNLERVINEAVNRDTAEKVKKEDDGGGGGEGGEGDVEMRDVPPPEPYKAVRLNLLALAKRAPIEMISHFPKELIPESYRHLIL